MSPKTIIGKTNDEKGSVIKTRYRYVSGDFDQRRWM